MSEHEKQCASTTTLLLSDPPQVPACNCKLSRVDEDTKAFTASVFVNAKMNVDPATLELVSGVTVGDISDELSRKTVELEEQALVEALIGMGWTPPPPKE
jgi:hypothetical protein